MRYHPALLRSIKDFNSGRYFEAHEALEDALDAVEDDDTTWQLFLGLIRVAVGYHKWTSGYPGAQTMLAMGLETLAPLPDECGGVRLETLRQRVRQDLVRVDTLSRGPGDHAPRITLTPRPAKSG